ncbi:MAG: glycosyl hydrolase family protein, partial [Planctomycetota bacterium]
FLSDPTKSHSPDNGTIACDHYHRYRDDVALMKQLGLRAYRFSISWPRVMPSGRGDLNPAGLDFYDRLIDELLAAGIQPLITLYHWDLPAALQHELSGWACDDLPEIFADYADAMFGRYADRVKFWLTLNEPWVVVDAGYFHGTHAPGVRDRALGYRVGHNLLRAHAYAVERFRARTRDDGAISFALNTTYSFPDRDIPADHEAAQRAMLAFGGWFADPAHFGDYPTVLRERLGDLLPRFSERDASLLRGSMDFIALNYYTSDRIRHAPGDGPLEIRHVPMPHVPKTEMDWPILPSGLYHLLRWLADRYDRLPIYITENGAALPDQPDENGFVDDQARITYLADHIAAMAAAMHAGVDVRGYFVWSLLDNLEWSLGFSKRFGIVRCDPATQRRTIKASGRWYAKLISAGTIESTTLGAPARLAAP